MKKYIAIALVALLAACTNKNGDTAQHNSERDSLIALLNQRDAAINDFLATSSEIESNLDAVIAKESTIKTGIAKGEVKGSSKDRINEDIATINNLMSENRKKVNELKAKLKGSNAQLAQYDQMIQKLNERIAQKDKEFAELNEKLHALNGQVAELQTSVENLTADNTAQAQAIEHQTTVMHTAYYIVGEAGELKDKKIISKTGGLLGIGKTSQLEPNIDNSKFTQIDYTKTSDIDVASKDVKIITSHPADSYTLDKQDNKTVKIRISNPEKFWSTSKYLVVVKD